jgi:hypothetical protein
MRSRFTILTLLLALLGTSCQRQKSDTPQPAASVRPAASQQAAAKTPGRPVFPYSVVSGGVSSPEEMADAVQQDPVVREHYAALRPASFRSEVLKEDQKGYVSYRIRDKVYWTRRVMTLKKGETVLTNGETMLRGRCGNRVSPVALSPTAPEAEEPTEAVLNSWQDSKLLAGIPPVPVSSPISGTLKLDRTATADPAPSSLLVPPGSSMFGLIVPPANTSNLGGVWIGGGGTPGGGGGGGPVNGGNPSTNPPATVPGTEPTPVPPITGQPPILIATGPPPQELPLGPNPVTVPPFTGQPPTVQPPNLSWPPNTTVPPVTIPPISVPPGTNPPPSVPPTTPPGKPPELPPGTGEPPVSFPPTVSDPPSSDFPPPGPPPEETAVPEPATVLLAAGALGLLGVARYFSGRR